MERRRLQTVSVDILSSRKVRINSEFTHLAVPEHKEITTDRFSSVTEAKRKLDSLSNMYKRFRNGYYLVLAVEATALATDLVKGVGDLVYNSEMIGNDILRAVLLAGMGFVTAAAAGSARENRSRISNKKSALERAEQSGRSHYRNTYTF